MIKLKKISCAVMSFVMLFAMSTSVFAAEKTTEDFSTPQNEYSRAVTPQIRQTGNRLSSNAGTAYASLLA